MSSVAVRVEGLGKTYHIGVRRRYKTLRESIARIAGFPLRHLRSAARSSRDSGDSGFIWALKDVSFAVELGDVLGIIGRNGAGKSTLLKILSRITDPTEGYAEIHGRIGSLLEVGTGFHPELTGRENIQLNGAILGMARTEITNKFDEIVAFAELEQFIDTPVKRYSSGMYLRLAFAVAAHLEPEILIVDEVLAVGDAQFQKKCLGKMEDVAKTGRTVLFVSHNMSAITRLCSKAAVLSQGRIIAQGCAADMVQHYLKNGNSVAKVSVSERHDRAGSGEIRIEEIWIEDGSGHQVGSVRSGDDLKVAFSFRCHRNWASPKSILKFILRDESGAELAICSTGFLSGGGESFRDEGVIRCVIPRLPLAEGEYSVSYAVGNPGHYYDSLENSFNIEVMRGDYFGSGIAYKFPKVYLNHHWIMS